MSSPITLTDLFAGAGGLTQGMRTASDRFVPMQAVEFETAPAATYRANHPGTDVWAGDILTWLDHGDQLSVDVVVGGPPCQGFSLMGKRDVNDERNLLWRAYAQAVERIQPAYFVMENVPQFYTSPEWEMFCEELEHGRLRDYEIAQPQILNSADYGTPQVRRRAIVLGTRRGMPALNYPQPTTPEPLTVRDGFAGIDPDAVAVVMPTGRVVNTGSGNQPGPYRSDELHVTQVYSEEYLERFAAIPVGGSRSDIPEHLRPARWRGADPTTVTDAFGRAHWDRPSVTLRTKFHQPDQGRYVHPDRNRGLTLFEGSRLQGFPDDYLWVGSKTAVARQIGNAVPVPLAAAVGCEIARLLS